jgi:predicted nucleotide-binding protein (sugar kinase/HSP70/actin superfamily)
MRIGIPKALIFWKEPFFWPEFFKNLGIEVVFSPKTNKEIIEIGTKVADPETCFSIKVFLGHVFFLEKKVDYIFIPRLIRKNSLGFEYCPKFFGLPDVAKLIVKTPILSPKIDLKKESEELIALKVGKKFSKDFKKIKKAIKKAKEKEEREEKKKFEKFFEKFKSNRKVILLISHPYNIYDDSLNLGLREKLKKLGVEIINIDEVPLLKKIKVDPRDAGIKIEPYPVFHWEFAYDIIAKIKEQKLKKISGVIEISSFQCGCDSVLKEFIEKEVRKDKTPFLYLVFDEHTGEAGLKTRLEAFIDTL